MMMRALIVSAIAIAVESSEAPWDPDDDNAVSEKSGGRQRRYHRQSSEIDDAYLNATIGGCGTAPPVSVLLLCSLCNQGSVAHPISVVCGGSTRIDCKSCHTDDDDDDYTTRHTVVTPRGSTPRPQTYPEKHGVPVLPPPPPPPEKITSVCETWTTISGTSVGHNCTRSKKVCFPGDAQVELQNGTEVTMSALKIGDSVRVGPSEFSEIYLFGHRDAGVKANFFKISTSTGKAIRLTGGHYLYVNGQLQTARAVKLGDMVSSGRVTAIDQVWADGLYNPHTMTGDIVVDGVLTSTYTESVAPSVAHGLLWPVRMLYNVGLLQLAGTFEIDGWFRSSGLILVSKLGLTGKAKEIKKY